MHMFVYGIANVSRLFYNMYVILQALIVKLSHYNVFLFFFFIYIETQTQMFGGRSRAEATNYLFILSEIPNGM